MSDEHSNTGLQIFFAALIFGVGGFFLRGVFHEDHDFEGDHRTVVEHHENHKREFSGLTERLERMESTIDETWKHISQLHNCGCQVHRRGAPGEAEPAK